MTRTKFVIVQQMIAATRSVSSLFEAQIEKDYPLEGELSPNELEEIANKIVSSGVTLYQVENLYTLINMVLESSKHQDILKKE